MAEPLEEPPDQRVVIPRIQARTGEGRARVSIAGAAGQFHHGELAGEQTAVFQNMLERGGGVIENLIGIWLRAPRGGMFGVRQQILGTERNALQRTAETLPLDITFHILGIANGVLAQRERECVVARADGLQTIAEGARQLHRGEFLFGEFLIDFRNAGEKDVIGNGAHGVAQGLKIVAGSAAIGSGNESS